MLYCDLVSFIQTVSLTLRSKKRWDPIDIEIVMKHEAHKMVKQRIKALEVSIKGKIDTNVPWENDP